MKPFVFYWKFFDSKAGIKYVIGILILYGLSFALDFTWIVVGISALLTWIMLVLGDGKRQLRMTAAYLVAGFVLTWISNLLANTYWPWVIFMFLVAFSGTALVRFGAGWFMFGWSLIYWFLLTPALIQISQPVELLLSHLLGAGSVLLLILVERFVKHWSGIKTDVQDEQNAVKTPWKQVLPYALIVAFIVVIGLMAGHQWLSSDPTWIANSAFMIIGFSMINTWKAGLERMLAALLGIVTGFILGVFIPGETFGVLFMLSTSFLVLALLKVNNALVVFLFVIVMSYGWGRMDYDTGNALANERIIAEFAGIVLAGVGITSLNYLTKGWTRFMK